MKRKILSSMLALTLAVSMLAGCSSQSENATTETAGGTGTTGTATETADGEMAVPSEIDLYVYYADGNIEVVDLALEAMKELYPDTEVIIEHRTDSDGTVLKSRAAIGELPDIVELTSTVLDVFVEADYLVPLNGVMEETNYYDKYIAGAFDAKLSQDGERYALHSTVPEACLMYYNKEVFANLGLNEPTNYEQFKVVVQTLVDAGITPLALFGAQRWPGLQMFDMAVVGQGQYEGIAALETGVANIMDPEFVVATERVEEVVSMGLVGSGALSTNASQAFELFEMGKAGMLVNGSWYLTDAVSNGVADNVGFFKYNPFTDEAMAEEVYGHVSGGAMATGGFGATKGEYEEFCSYFVLDFLEQFSIARESVGTPTLLADKLEGVEIPQCIQEYSALIEEIKTTSLYGWSMSSPEILAALEGASELLITANYPSADFLADLESDISAVLDEDCVTELI